MTHRWVGALAPRVRLAAADLLTASRLAVAAAFLAGRPAPGAAVMFVVWAWLSDALDGPLARSTGCTGRLAVRDHPADAAVAIGLVWYLGDLGVVPALETRAVAGGLLVLWAATRVFAVQMLLTAAAYAAFTWWAFAVAVAERWLIVVVVAGLAVAERRRLVGELVPAFLTGWRDLFTGRRR